MERELFDYSHQDSGRGFICYYSVTLKVRVGDYLPGTKFHYAEIHQNKGLLKLYNNDFVYNEFRLSYKVS